MTSNNIAFQSNSDLEGSKIAYRPGQETQTQAVNAQVKITEVIIPQAANSQQIIFPLVASMSHHNNSEQQPPRWLTWITDRKPSRTQLETFSARSESIRIIHSSPDSDNRWLLWEALSTGNSHTVIAETAALNSEDLTALESAARQGETQGIFIRSL